MAREIPVDLILEIHYEAKDWAGCFIKTNIRREVLEDFLYNWIATQVGRGCNREQPSESRAGYNIKIGYSIREDIFCLESDCNDDALTCGIVVAVVLNLDKVELREH